jgi:hypothetical protein
MDQVRFAFAVLANGTKVTTAAFPEAHILDHQAEFVSVPDGPAWEQTDIDVLMDQLLQVMSPQANAAWIFKRLEADTIHITRLNWRHTVEVANVAEAQVYIKQWYKK